MDDARLFAWIDGELEAAEAEAVAAAVAADPTLAARAEMHRKLKARVATSFGPLLEKAAALPPRKPAAIVSLAEARARRQAREQADRAVASKARRRIWPGAIAAVLLAGLFVAHQIDDGAAWLVGQGAGTPAGLRALTPAMATALDTQAMGQAGPLRVTMSFRDKTGRLCRRFIAEQGNGVACRVGQGWALRDAADAPAVRAMIAGAPLDAAQEKAAQAAGWK